MLNFIDADPESGIFFFGSGREKIGFEINFPDSLHCSIPWFSAELIYLIFEVRKRPP
jgi:hypothetical protein